MKAIVFLGITIFLYLLVGCASSPDPTRANLDTANKLALDQRVPETLKPYYQRLYLEGESNATLNRMRLASAAIERGEWKDAEQVLNVVVRDIEALGPADARSREALSSFEGEAIKRFKGEPYERSMAYFLRGLLYLKSEEWDNARACFKSVQIQDAAKPDPILRGNWASAHWLEGWCNWNLGETSAAQECWTRAELLRKMPRPSSHNDAIIVALLGFGPTKIPTGSYGEKLTYRKGYSQATQCRIKTMSSTQSLILAEDILAQAESRGLRNMDIVNRDKAEARSTTETAGDVLVYGGIGTTVGGAVTNNTTVTASGLGVAATGMITKGVASSMNPKADTRTWDLLPANIQLLPIHVSSANQTLEFQFLDSNGKTISERKIEIQTDSKPQLILLIQR